MIGFERSGYSAVSVHGIAKIRKKKLDPNLPFVAANTFLEPLNTKWRHSASSRWSCKPIAGPFGMLSGISASPVRNPDLGPICLPECWWLHAVCRWYGGWDTIIIWIGDHMASVIFIRCRVLGFQVYLKYCLERVLLGVRVDLDIIQGNTQFQSQKLPTS